MASLDWYIRSHLKLRHLQLLVALDEFRNVGKVASYLNVTQPAISKSLSELETSIDLKLFHRSAHGMDPTIYGASLVRHAKSILTELGKARDELRALASGVEGKVSIGALPAAALATLPKGIARLKQLSPETAVNIREGTMDQLQPQLRSGDIELVIGIIPVRFKLVDTEVIPLYEDTMVLAIGSHHPLAKCKQLSWRDLQECSWILPPNDSLVREPIEGELFRHNISMPKNYVESVSTMTNIGILQNSDAVAFLPQEVAQYYANFGILTILPFSLPRLMRPIGIMHMKEQALSPSAMLLINALQEIYWQPETDKTHSSAMV